MTDRELLELAAKAAGWTVVRWTDDETALLLEGIQEPFNALHENQHSDCMGDALRLSVRLGMCILCHATQVECPIDGKIKIFTEQKFRNEAATRRAIVRAAAEVGKSMTTGANHD